MIISDKKVIGLKIKQRRKRLKLTQFELAELVGIHEKQIQRIEAGAHFPTLENFIKIANALDLDLMDFEQNEAMPVKSAIEKVLNESSEKELRVFHDILCALRRG